MILNKYKKWYDDLIQNAKARVLIDQFESHHVVPRSLGGSDSPENLVNLTLREHYIAHLLLSKIYKGNDAIKMAQALAMMSGKHLKNKSRFNSKKYELAKTLIRKIYYNAGKEYNNELKLQSSVLEEYTDLEKVYERGVCKECKIRPRSVNYTKNGRTFYRSKCDICNSGKTKEKIPRWVFEGYKKKQFCESCNFQAKFSEQLTVHTTDRGKYQTVCLNCQIFIRLTPRIHLKPDL